MSRSSSSSCPERADVYVSGDDDDAATWQLVRALDAQGVRAINAPVGVAANDEAVRRVMATCSGLVAAVPARESEPGGSDPDALADVRRAAELGLAVAVLAAPGVRVEIGASALRVGAANPIALPQCGAARALDDADAASAWLDALSRLGAPRPPFAFFVGRLERDFAQAREAVRVAVEREAGIACLWSDDGRHRVDVASVREHTRLLIREACFVIADLTLGREPGAREPQPRARDRDGAGV